MTKLIIVSASRKIKAQPAGPIPALQRFEGAFIEQIRKYYQSLRDVDVLILSPAYGLIAADDEIPYKEPLIGPWNRLVLSEGDFVRLREPSLRTLRSWIDEKAYDEIYVNLGRELQRIIQGFELTLPKKTKVTYAQGSGMGPKMAHMRDWIKPNLTGD